MPENAPAHTPGPWNSIHQGYGYINISTSHNLSAEPHGQHVATAYQGPSIGREESIANARLIAAAPDLLAALQQMRREFDPYDPTDKQAAACDAADAAIAKALGK